MNIEQLEHIVEVAKTGAISIASENLHITQSGISRSIKNLEEEIGIKLFKRSKLGTVLTEEGKPIIKKACEIVIKLKEFNEVVQLQTFSIQEELKISASQSIFLTVLLKALSNFNNDYPNISVEITERESNDIIKDIIQNNIDLGLAVINNEIREEEDLIFETVMEGKMNVCVHKHSPLAFSKTLTPQELLDQPLVMYNGENMKMFINDFFNKYGSMHILFKSNNTEVIKRAVAEGIAVSFFVDLGFQNDPYVQNGDIVLIPLSDCGPINVPFGWVRSRKQHYSNAAREFLKYLKVQISELQ